LILLDTSVLSLAFRRRTVGASETAEVARLRRLIEEDEPLAIPGIVAQELLSGVRDDRQATRLQGLIEGFPWVLATREHHIRAAQIANRCRRAGITVSTPDCLIAATAVELGAELLTLDTDFTRIAGHAELRLLPLAGA
jgi:hypothetical protein